jgi:hypothetical protein
VYHLFLPVSVNLIPQGEKEQISKELRIAHADIGADMIFL